MNPKKMAAAAAAVVTYIKSQEELARYAVPLEISMDEPLKPKDAGPSSCADAYI